MTYDLGGADADSFDLEPTTGQLLTNAPLNHEERTIYNVIVTVTDPSLVTASQSVTIAITNVEEPGIATLSTPTPGEGERVDAVFEDPDGGVTDESWAWARSADGSTNWTVITGQVSSNYVATSDDIGHYLRATVFYTDAQGSGKEAEAVSLNPVHAPVDHVPYFSRDENFQRSIVENELVGTPVGEPFRAFDQDGHEITFFLVDPPENFPFELDPVTGQLRTTRVLNYELTSLYIIVIAIHDAGHDHAIDEHSSDATASVVIVVENVKETDARLSQLRLGGLVLSPVFSPDKYVYTASAPDALQQIVVDVSAIDPSARSTYLLNDFPTLPTIDLTGRGPFVFEVLVRTEDRDDSKDYEVIISKPSSPRVVVAEGTDEITVVHDTEDVTIKFDVVGVNAVDEPEDLRLVGRIYRRDTKERVEECEGAGFGSEQPYTGNRGYEMTVSTDCPFGEYSIDVRLLRYFFVGDTQVQFKPPQLVAHGLFNLDVTHSRGTHVARINRIDPDIRSVTVSPGDEVRLAVNIYGRQDILDNEHGGIHTFDWRDRDAGGGFDGSGRQVTYTAPSVPGRYTVTAALDRDECFGMSVEACTAIFQVIVKRRTATVEEAPPPVNPSGAIPTILTDDDGTAYEVVTPVEGGTYTDDGFALDVPPGAVPNGELIGVSVLEGEPASNAGRTHHRYTLGGDWYHVAVVDGDGMSGSSYLLNSPVSVCVPLPAGLRSNIDDLSIVAMKSDGFAVITSRVQLRPDGNTQICGSLGELPAQVAAAKRGSPTALPTSDATTSEPETPDTGGSAPTPNLPRLLALLGMFTIMLGSYLALKGKRTPSRTGERNGE